MRLLDKVGGAVDHAEHLDDAPHPVNAAEGRHHRGENRAGDAPGRFVFGTDSLVDRPGSGGGSLAKALQVTLTDVTDSGHPRRVYSGALSGLSGIDLGSFAPGATRTYRIAATLQPQTASSTAYADCSLALSFQWTAVTPD